VRKCCNSYCFVSAVHSKVSWEVSYAFHARSGAPGVTQQRLAGRKANYKKPSYCQKLVCLTPASDRFSKYTVSPNPFFRRGWALSLVCHMTEASFIPFFLRQANMRAGSLPMSDYLKNVRPPIGRPRQRRCASFTSCTFFSLSMPKSVFKCAFQNSSTALQ
jgi:hypothetical protein